MLDFAGVPTPAQMQGRSFRDVCETGREPDDWKQAAYYRYWMHLAHHWNPSHFGIRTKQYKLIFYYGCDMQGRNRTPPGWELYDLEKDPHEVCNVYNEPGYAEVVCTLKDHLARRRQEIGDTDENFPAIQEIVEEFWDYDDRDRAEAIAISHAYAEQQRKRPKRHSPKVSRLAEVLPGGWIKPAESEAPLRAVKGVQEISRNAVYRMSARGPAAFNVDNAYLLSGDPPPVKPHAFHSPENAENPFIVIRLEEHSKVRYVRIVNRTNGFLDRAEGLTLWISDDGEQWRRLWQAPEVAAEWLVDCATETRGRYLKLGLTRRGTLHLNQVTVFGE